MVSVSSAHLPTTGFSSNQQNYGGAPLERQFNRSEKPMYFNPMYFSGFL